MPPGHVTFQANEDAERYVAGEWWNRSRGWGLAHFSADWRSVLDTRQVRKMCLTLSFAFGTAVRPANGYRMVNQEMLTAVGTSIASCGAMTYAINDLDGTTSSC